MAHTLHLQHSLKVVKDHPELIVKEIDSLASIYENVLSSN